MKSEGTTGIHAIPKPMEFKVENLTDRTFGDPLPSVCSAGADEGKGGRVDRRQCVVRRLRSNPAFCKTTSCSAIMNSKIGGGKFTIRGDAAVCEVLGFASGANVDS